ncbi:MAG: hypothetical protein QGH41_13820, partial [Roseibacillus sp.]|nr:hypothetical protein [Roseibacillus sp.]
LGPVKTPYYCLSSGVSPGIDGSTQLPGQPPDELAPFLGRQLRLVLGRHFTAIEHVQGVVPGLSGMAVHHVRIQLIQPKFPFLLFRTVAGKAMLLQYRSHVFLENIPADCRGWQKE